MKCNVMYLAVAIMALSAVEIRSSITNECCNPTIIATLPYDITVPGYYVLKSDFTYNAALSTIPAISIDADHVVLDLCSHSLSQSQANVTPGVNGIQINPSHNDIEIRN